MLCKPWFIRVCNFLCTSLMNCSLYQNNMIPFFILLIAFQKQNVAQRASSKDGFAAICSHQDAINKCFSYGSTFLIFFFIFLSRLISPIMHYWHPSPSHRLHTCFTQWRSVSKYSVVFGVVEDCNQLDNPRCDEGQEPSVEPVFGLSFLGCCRNVISAEKGPPSVDIKDIF